MLNVCIISAVVRACAVRLARPVARRDATALFVVVVVCTRGAPRNSFPKRYPCVYAGAAVLLVCARERADLCDLAAVRVCLCILFIYFGFSEPDLWGDVTAYVYTLRRYGRSLAEQKKNAHTHATTQPPRNRVVAALSAEQVCLPTHRKYPFSSAIYIPHLSHMRLNVCVRVCVCVNEYGVCVRAFELNLCHWRRGERVVLCATLG